ncbi:MAG: type II toxin-antitoxin system VapC family toxin [Candidatus Bathyarchaeia archaeon]
MRGQISYLDSSAMAKRYLKESGSEIIRSLYLKAYNGDAILTFTILNIGEVIGVFDRTSYRIGDPQTYRKLKSLFLGELNRIIKLGICRITPLNYMIIRQSCLYIEKHHIYIADAIQIASAKIVNSDAFYTGDKKLHEIACKEGMNSIYLG